LLEITDGITFDEDGVLPDSDSFQVLLFQFKTMFYNFTGANKTPKFNRNSVGTSSKSWLHWKNEYTRLWYCAILVFAITAISKDIFLHGILKLKLHVHRSTSFKQKNKKIKITLITK